ncbi:MAG: electron transport complex subunit RsxC [Firmicutes bacterium HGW-Firmicutes-16]|nr:MAG: electron transport complex subunit RsxC [Firmicutes bacterium HGW-Firmicutes-16]
MKLGGETVYRKTLHGVRVPHRKNTAGDKPEKMPIPAFVTIPMSMHIGAAAKPIVNVGDEVKVGQLIAEAGGFVSSPVYSGVSGKVKKLDDMLMSGGQFVPAITIETDGLQTMSESIEPPKVESLQEFLDAVRASGVVGLGGAGFPTAVKLTVKDLSAIEAVIINGAECEPYITSDTRTMLDDKQLVWEGIELLKKYMQVKRIIIGIEDNKPECISTYKKLCVSGGGVEVKALPAMYPQGGEKVLIFHTIGRIVPEGKLPLDVGAIVINCTTLAAVAKYIKTGIPLVEKCITVDGSAVKNPKNVIAPIGTPIKDVFDFCGGFKSEPKKVLYGGPMMGLAVPNLDAPILKNTNAILAFNEKDAVIPAETACIKCGRCVSHCPLNLAPTDIETAFKLKKPEDLDVLKVNLCMECGCCAYVCPANRPLVQINKLAKAMLRDYQNAQKAATEMLKKKEEAKKEEKK